MSKWMHRRPVSWPMVVIGLMGIGIGAVGIVMHLVSAAPSKSFPVGSCVIAVIGVASVILGWFHEPND